MRFQRTALTFIALAFLSTLFAQTVLNGLVRDAESGAPLPAANIQIDGTYRGTISNNQGEYQLDITDLPATLKISYIGYRTKQVVLNAPLPGNLDIQLEPVTYTLDEIIVTDEDPAVNIMRKVIEKKQEWRARLNTYRAEAYTRQNLSNDSGIVSITESTSESFWDRKKGPREVIKSKRQTSNVKESNNFAGASYVANFYDDDIELQGFRMIGPTHPDAIKHYHFKLVDRRHLDEKVVYDISVTPKGKLQPTFVGDISVLDEDYALIRVDLTPNEHILFPMPIQSWSLAYKQQFSNFGKDFWLPVDVRISGSIKIGMIGLDFPPISYQQISQLTNYQVNIELPDSLYEDDDQLVVDSLAIKQNDGFASMPQTIPLSTEENDAYDDIDSTMTLEKAFKPSGFLARAIEISEGDDDDAGGEGRFFFSKYLTPIPHVWFNRVDGGHFGLALQTNTSKRYRLTVTGGYKTGIEKWSWRLAGKLKFGGRNATTLFADIGEGTDTRYQSDTYNVVFNSFLPLFDQADYFDYYWNHRSYLGIEQRIRPLRSRLTLGLHAERHSSLRKQTDYAFFNSSAAQRENPAINTGKLRAVSANITFGDAYIPYGVVGQTRASISFEHSSDAIFSSEFEYNRVSAAIDWRLNTFLRRRILPNSLDMRFVAGISSDATPLQKLATLDGNFQAFTPFGTFRTLNGRPYEGNRYVAVFWEHNFRTVPFELLGLRSLARRGISIIAHGASGRTWLENDNQYLNELTFQPFSAQQFHHEAGISINNIMGLLRLDFTQRLDEPDFRFGISMARLF